MCKIINEHFVVGEVYESMVYGKHFTVKRIINDNGTTFVVFADAKGRECRINLEKMAKYLLIKKI